MVHFVFMDSLFRRVTPALGLALLMTTVSLAQAPKVETKQIKTLAIVNGQEISRQQIADETMRRFGSDTLEAIVNKLLVMLECQRAGIEISNKDVNDQIINSAKKFGMSAERYMQTICGRRNITPDRFKNDFVWNELALRRLAASQIKVTPEELNQRMEFQYGAKVQVRQIVVDSLQQANELRERATQNPAEFERLAKRFSVDLNSKSVGGLLPPVRRHAGFPELEELAFGLQPGEISRVIPFAEKFLFLRCERHYPAEQVSNEQLVQIHDRLSEEISNEKLAATASQLFEKLQKSTKIVNVLNDEKLRQQMPGVAALVNDRPIQVHTVAEDCIARFGMDMLDTEINRTLLIQALKQQGLQVEQDDLNREIARAAEMRGYLNNDGSVNVDQWLTFVTGNNQSKVQFYIEDEVWPTVALKKLVAQSVQVTDEDIQKGFEANFGPRVEVLGIVLPDHRTALKVWNMASAKSDREYFGQLANQYSIDVASKNNFGEIPPIQRHGPQPELESEAYRLKPGEISKTIQVGDSWVILYCLGRTEPVVTDLDAVKKEIYDDILEKKMRLAMAAKFQELRAAAQIDNFLAGTSQPGAAAVRQARENSGLRR